MATWEDGPEYAPLERPDQFSAPETRPLDDGPQPTAPSAEAPPLRPEGYEQQEQRPLSTFEPDPGEQRNPQEPFEVAASTLTDEEYSATAWNAVHWTPPADSAWAPPAGAGVAGPPPPSGHDPTRPFHVSQQSAMPPPAQDWSAQMHAQQVNGQQMSGQQWPPPGGQQWPAPGTPQWFGPGPSEQPWVQQPETGGEFAQSLLRGVGIPTVICLLLGLVQPIAPLTLVLAFFSATRLQGTLCRQTIAICYYVCFGIIVFLSAYATVSGAGLWDVASLTATWLSIIMLVVSTLIVMNALRTGRGDTPTNNWG